jgi:hypothetical protein
VHAGDPGWRGFAADRAKEANRSLGTSAFVRDEPTRHLAACLLQKKPQVSRLCEAAKAPDDFFNSAKLDFADREKRILWVAFSRRMVDVRGEMTFAAGTIGGTT